MHLVRYTVDGKNWLLGALAGERIVQLHEPDLLTLIEEGEGGLQRARELVAKARPADAPSGPGSAVRKGAVKLGAPLVNPPKLICIGLNYREHARETNKPIPKAPVVFSKFASAIAGPEDPIIIPPVTSKVDYEVELAVVIGRGGRNIPEGEALEHVFGYTIMNDVSARDLQTMDTQWLKGKTLDTFAPMGPAVVTRDEIPDPQALRLYMKRNGEIVQDATTADMIFSVAYLIRYLSSLFTLQPGDVIATGTPEGVIMGQENPRWLQDGEMLEAGIEGIGVLRNPVRAE
ncbi:MAG: fumarylacetoacetate hydrolase family protein [Firmicutes bacterium]|jgi:2-keto-4-pentenoate hydratase/2-oxohepta-3-ene-1,7-dioic acid hydratase in catechol pathway|nr:fumarylacetoacetate hydrolase family protein [Bacillota bacterium]